MLPTTPEFALNAGIHLLNAGLLVVALRRLGAEAAVAAIGALVFAIDPAQLPVLCGPTGGMLAVSAWILGLLLHSLRRPRGRATAVDLGLIAVMGAGYAASASILLLPAALLVVDVTASGRRDLRRMLLEKSPLIAGACLGSVHLWLGAGPTDPFAASISAFERVGTVAGAWTRALGTLAGIAAPVPFPAGPTADPPGLGTLVLAAVSILVLGLVAWRRPKSRTGWLWCALVLLPATLDTVRNPLRAHGPELAVALVGVGWALASSLPQARRPRRAIAALLLVALAARSAHELPYWTGETRLLRRTVLVEPAHWVARSRLAERLAADGTSDEAITQYAAALQQQPRFSWAQAGLADVLVELGRVDDARLLYENVLHTGWSDPVAGPRLAYVFLRIGLDEAAVTLFERGLRVAPTDGDLHAGLALALARCGRPDEAKVHLRGALGSGPTGADGRYCAAWLLATAPEPGLRDPVRALDLVQPGDPPRLRDAEAAALAASGRNAAAFSAAQAAAANLEREGWPQHAAEVRDRARRYLQGEPWTETRASGPAAHREVHQEGEGQDRRQHDPRDP